MTAPESASLESLKAIPVGHYHKVLEQGQPVRRAWHLLKFTRVLESLPEGSGLSIIDVGCFAGSFLSLLPEERFGRQLGVDILPAQIEFAQAQFGTPFREFRPLPDLAAMERIDERFDCLTLIEVIEHLTPEEIRITFKALAKLLRPGGSAVISTPNYASTWPLLEMLLNRFSDVGYSEQHITRFTAFNMVRRLRELAPTVDEDFEVRFLTTSHLLSPFLAALTGVEGAQRISRLVPHRRWRVPFGNLVLLGLRRR
jgi:2-polyprenyl-3-methyl-5-hydroxy-6-metoxy-1,4-benzoquinol methylase